MTESKTSMDVNAYFSKYEGIIVDWKSAIENISKVIDGSKTLGPRNLVWRGLTDSLFWPDSSLYRYLQQRNLSLLAEQKGRPPFEEDLLTFETELLKQARYSWRFDHLSTLETFAQIRHHGGPTRLLDVTFNPLIALWFSVETQYDDEGNELPDIDGRMFAFDVTDNEILLDHEWGGRDLPWSSKGFTDKRGYPPQEPHWIWKPPSYNERIPAQNSAFLIGRVPHDVERRWKYLLDVHLQSILEKASAPLRDAALKLGSMRVTSPEWSYKERLSLDLHRITSVEREFETLQSIWQEMEGLMMAAFEIEAPDRDEIELHLIIELDQDLDIIRNFKGEFKDDDSGERHRAFVESTTTATEDEFKDLDQYVIEMSDWLVDSLVKLKERRDEIEDWIHNRGEYRTFSSAPMNLTGIDEVPHPDWSTTYTLRIAATAKEEIRQVLEKSYGYSAATLYPDIMGLAAKGANLVRWPL